MAIGLRQLAEICDVSHTTVSRALKNDPRISDAVRERVHKVAASYNYKPNHLVKGVMSGKSQSIAVVLSDSSRDVGGILNPIQQFFLEKSYSTYVYNTTNDPKLELLSFHEAACHRVEGLVIAPADQQAKDAYFKELRRYELPFVIIGPNVESVNVPHVSVDDHGATASIVDHLCKLGHSRIALLRGSMTHDVMDKRYSGYLDGMKKHGHPVNLDWVFPSGWKPSETEVSVQALMKVDNPPTALICVNDSIAMGAMKGLHQMGLSIPKDVSIVGMGDDYFSRYLTPALTTTSSIRAQVGLTAAKRLWKMIDEPESDSKDGDDQIMLQVELIVRDSTGPAPSSRNTKHKR